MHWHRLASISRSCEHELTRGPKRFSVPWHLALVVLFSGCMVPEEVVQESEPAAPSPSLVAPPPGAPGASQSRASQTAQKMIAEDEERIEFATDEPNLNSPTRRELRESELEAQARATDAELSEAEGGAGSAFAQELGSLESELGLEPKGSGNDKKPSLALGIGRIKQLYKMRSFEAALIETNRMLEFYPRSPQLLLMKGTLHQWLGQLDLALVSYREAASRRPSPKLAAQIRYLEMKIKERERLKGWVEGEVIPGGPESVESSFPVQTPKPSLGKEGVTTSGSGGP